jgi:hypothetical protein
MTEYYQMTPKTCFLCKDNDGMAEDGTPSHPAFKKCEHKIGIGILDLQIHEAEQLLKELKRSKRYAKIVRS